MVASKVLAIFHFECPLVLGVVFLMYLWDSFKRNTRAQQVDRYKVQTFHAVKVLSGSISDSGSVNSLSEAVQRPLLNYVCIQPDPNDGIKSIETKSSELLIANNCCDQKGSWQQFQSRPSIKKQHGCVYL